MSGQGSSDSNPHIDDLFIDIDDGRDNGRVYRYQNTILAIWMIFCIVGKPNNWKKLSEFWLKNYNYSFPEKFTNSLLKSWNEFTPNKIATIMEMTWYPIWIGKETLLHMKYKKFKSWFLSVCAPSNSLYAGFSASMSAIDWGFFLSISELKAETAESEKYKENFSTFLNFNLQCMKSLFSGNAQLLYSRSLLELSNDELWNILFNKLKSNSSSSIEEANFESDFPVLTDKEEGDLMKDNSSEMLEVGKGKEKEKEKEKEKVKVKRKMKWKMKMKMKKTKKRKRNASADKEANANNRQIMVEAIHENEENEESEERKGKMKKKK